MKSLPWWAIAKRNIQHSLKSSQRNAHISYEPLSQNENSLAELGALQTENMKEKFRPNDHNQQFESYEVSVFFVFPFFRLFFSLFFCPFGFANLCLLKKLIAVIFWNFCLFPYLFIIAYMKLLSPIGFPEPTYFTGSQFGMGPNEKRKRKWISAFCRLVRLLQIRPVFLVPEISVIFDRLTYRFE